MEKETRKDIYEIGYLLVPSITEENLGAEVTSFKDSLVKHDVAFISDEFPKMIELAYEMTRSISNKKQRFSYGYFGWVKFECEPREANIIKDELERNEKLIRFLLIKTVRESTMSPRKSFKQDSSKRRPSKAQEVVAPVINEETIDKEIDALVS
jgi:ribosomal protein S6